MTTLWHILVSFWAVLAEMAPWLLFGFLAAGVLSVFFKPTWIERHLGGGGPGPVVKAAVFGVPLPVCSCGVIPLATGLYRHGASKGATSSFLISTPQTGVDSILATWGLMGPVFGVVRPVVALVSGIFGGLLINRVDHRDGSLPVAGASTTDEQNADGACCGSGGVPPADSWFDKARSALRYALITLPADLAGVLIVGLSLAAVLTAVVDPELLQPWFGHPVWGLLLAVLIGLPVYVCSTASIPVAVGLMAVGASPGAALAFLIAGPATNAATVSVVWNVLGKRSAVAYAGVVLAMALGAGGALNAATGAGLGLMLPDAVLHPHEHTLTGLDHTWAALMVGVLMLGLATRWGVGPRAEPAASTDTHGLAVTGERLTIPVEGMTCSHCAASVERELRTVGGVRQVTVDLARRSATVLGVGLERGPLESAVRQAGFRVPG